MTRLVEVAPEKWDGLLEQIGVGDVYFRTAYLESADLLGQGRPVYLHMAGEDGHVVFPCLVREAPEGHADVGTPMGYGGPLAVGSAPPVAGFFDAYERWCDAGRVVATFARFHPPLGNQALAQGRWRLEHIGHAIGWRVAGRTADELLAGMSSHHRRVARKALAAEVDVDVSEAPAALDDFVELYEATMRRRKASAFYFFPAAYWAQLTGPLREAVVRADAVVEGELVASAVCLASAPLLHYHLGASSERGQALGANQLLFWKIASWASERGYSVVHLGGGVGGFEDSLYEFKRRFDPEGMLPAYLGKAVHDVAAYRRLADDDEVDYAGFFPAYRRTR